ncbi:MAG TPA: universal stress protein [Kineosporiaceae bacterium]|nr:universal stress protein [Kineosporiaceae bacterium]
MSEEASPPTRGFELGTDGPIAIVVGVDGTPTSLDALAYAVGLARREHSKLIAVYVRTLTRGALTLADPAQVAVEATVEAQDDVEADLRRRLQAITSTLPVRARLVVGTGDPLTVLSDVAEQVRADAVIVGASTSVAHRIAGSLAVRLVRSRRWPVTIVP